MYLNNGCAFINQGKGTLLRNIQKAGRWNYSDLGKHNDGCNRIEFSPYKLYVQISRCINSTYFQ